MSSKFNVLYVGAGIVNFGGAAGPWNHSKRLEQKLGPRLNVLGIIEIRPEAARAVLDRKNNEGIAGYENAQVFTTVAEARQALTDEQAPQLAVIGIHCAARGSTRPGRDMELQLVRAFPKIALFLEKPLSTDTFEEVTKLSEALTASGTLTSVGYMLRYVKAVQHMKSLIADNHLTVMATQARYLMAYKFVGNTYTRIAWWDKDKQFGPIVEQATHICDLSRYFSPAPILDSVQVHTIEHFDPPGKLSELTIDEDKRVEPQNRIPRVTNAIWRYESGAVGSLFHGTVLHEGEYAVELAVMADGWCMRLVNPYNEVPKLYVRRPGHEEELIDLGKDDCYYSEVSAIVDVIEGKADKSAILSTFEDAAESYKMTYAIRWKGEEVVSSRVNKS